MARNVEDITKYWQKVVKDQGVPQEQADAVLKLLSDEAAGKAFAQAFVPQSDYSRDLDKARDEWKGKADEALAKVNQYNDWYEKTAKPATEQYAKTADRLKKYEETFGALEDGARQQVPPDVVTKKDLEEWTQRSAQNTARVMKDLSSVTVDHFKRFGDTLDVEALEKFAVENNLPIRQAYDSMIQPRLRERETADWEAKVKAAKEEGARDYASRHQLPVDPKPTESHPFFDRKEVPQGTSAMAQERASREAFFAGLNEPAGTATR